LAVANRMRARDVRGRLEDRARPVAWVQWKTPVRCTGLASLKEERSIKEGATRG